MKNNSKFNRGFLISLAILSIVFLSSTKFVKADTFMSDLSIGSSGSSVVSLQTWLINNGYLVMPSGVSTGYFGQLTKAALIKYQLSQGITPAVGYFGPITRAKMSTAVIIPNPASTNNQPIISISPTSGSVGTPVTVSVTNSIPVVNGNIYFDGFAVLGASSTISGTQFTFTVPQKIYSGCPVVIPQSNISVDCDPILTSLQPGVYQIYVQMDSTTTNSLGTIISGPSTVSNKVNFMLTAPASSTQPSITLVSPNGGEIWKAGTNQTITVNVVGDTNYSGNYAVNLFLVDSSGNVSNRYSLGGGLVTNMSGTKSFQVTLPTNYIGSDKIYAVLSLPATPVTCQPGYVGCASDPQIIASDFSDNYFTVTN